VTDVESYVVEIDVRAFGLALAEDSWNVRTFHKAIMGFGSPKFVGFPLH
jgi:hypothetical protein